MNNHLQYGYKKQVTRLMEASSQLLAILMGMLRSSLGGAWEEPRRSLGAAWSEAKGCLKRYFCPLTANIPPSYSEKASLSQREGFSLIAKSHFAIFVFLMLILGSGNVWGQDYSGVYYIGTAGYNASTPTNNYYLCPTEGWIYYKPNNQWSEDGTTYPNPFLTTYQCKTNNYHSGDPSNAVWYVEKHPTQDYYYIKHASDGKYVISNGQIDGTSNANRMRVHLEDVAPEDLDDKALFSISPYEGGYLVISPKSSAGWNGNYKWYTVNSGNKSFLVGSGSNGGPTGHTETGGIIGTYTQNDANAKFYLENALSIDAPIITNNNDGTFTITADEGATIYYTIDGTEPTTSSSTYSAPITQTESMRVIKAIAKAASDPFPTFVTTYNLPVCEKPIIIPSGNIITITCTTEGAIIHYTTNGDPATSSSATYTGPFDKGSATEIRAIATKAGYVNSSEAAILPPTEVSSSDEMTDMGGNYILASDFSSNASIGTSENPFSGTIDGNMVTLSGLNHPLVAYANGATIKNVMLENVQISGSGNVGAIAGVASGYTCIYNCGILPSNNKYENESSYVSSSDGYCGGLVGWLKDDSRVINCFSYANITGGTTVAGIVGYNDFASTAEESDGKYTKLKTAIVNCMFYGNITGGTTRYPVYGGEKILNNTATGINNYDFYRAEANLGLVDNSHYNCSWPAQEEYLTKYEYYRYLLNSNRELCGWWVGAPSAPSGMLIADVQAVEKDASLMAKWVLDPSIAPYPILKAPGKYYSAINQDPDNRINPISKTWESRLTSENTITTKAAPDTEGQKLGSITVNINKGGGLSGSDSKNIPITAMDIENNDFCYGKIQLPYYNSIFGDPNSNDWATRYGGNYGAQVVVGWEISAIEGGVAGITNNEDKGHKFTEDWQDGYNFADRYCTTKDQNRTFAQGGYYYVPNGVTEITITAKWADATYLDNNDNYYDRISVSSVSSSTASSTFSPFEPAGKRSATLGNGKTVKTGSILSNLQTGSVYEKAIVLVGNNQNFTGNAHYGKTDNGFTVMSADFDLDNEPDYSLIWQLGNQTSRYNICPIRFDFLPVIEMGMAMKEDGSTQYYSLGCYRPLGHFEVTETSLIHFGQFEFANQNRSLEAPLILNGGIYDQFTKGTGVGHAVNDDINYMIIGGNVYMPSFTPGAHVNNNANYSTRHCAVNVLGGRINNLYLTGNFNNNVTPNVDNPHCYIDGGNFKQVAAAGKEGIDGDVFFNINHSVIEEFYGGSTMDQSTGNNFKTVKGDINVTVDNSKITKYCGGPKFGNMNLDEDNPANNKTVTTNATGTTFGVYYGGGNGGTSYVQYAKTDVTETNAQNPYDWDSGSKGNLNSYSPNTYRGGDKNYVADYEMEIVNSSAGTDANKGIFRTYFYAAQFSATNTGPITNNLTDCKVLTSFYGGGNLGGVIGDVESTLTDTEVMGSAFGAGYSASVPEVTIYNKNKTAPTLNVYTGIITPTPDSDPTSTYTTYTWTNKTSLGGQTLSTSHPAVLNVDGVNYFYTEESLENLGTVKGKVTLKIEGTTTIVESVYGGGEESGVDGNTEVTVNGGFIGAEGRSSYGYRYGNVYGGGKGKIDSAGELAVSKVADLDAGLVKGNTTVTINGTTETTKIVHNVYGGGAVGSVGTFTRDANGNPTACTSGGQATVTINGGQVGHNRKDSGMVNGSSRGWEGNPNGEGAFAFLNQLAWVNNGIVTIGDATTNDEDKGPAILGSVYGGGENGHNYNDGSVTINKGTIGNAASSAASYDCGNVYGAGCGTDTYWIDANENDNQDEGEEHHNPMAGLVRGNTSITINGGNILRNVYGAGSMGSVGNDTDAESGKTTITINGGTIGRTEDSDHGHVFGGPKGNLTETEFKASVKSTLVNINAHPSDATKNPIVWGSVFGGGEAGIIKGSVAVNMNGGTVKKDVYGGGALADTQTDNWDETKNSGAGDWAEGKTSASNTTLVRLTGGDILGEAYGGGLGEPGKPAYVYGDVLVDLNGTTTSGEEGAAIATTARGCAVNQVFGCNNAAGTPMGEVLVHVYATQNKTKSQIGNTDGETPVTDAKVKGSYDVTAVYGGGNLAAYEPAGGKETTNSTNVIIDGCELTSIQTVYGGGNAASTPATNVIVNGTYEILEVFGGGNGLDNLPDGRPNPGANVGYKNYTIYTKVGDDWVAKDDPDYDTKEERTAPSSAITYGTGQASVNVFGGTVHRVFGGSNTKGNVRQTAVTLLDENSGCEFCVDEAYGGGKSAPMDAEAKLLMSCIPGLQAAYGGAEAAAIKGNVTLNITNGTFDRVFGGNNLSGTIDGSITVNIQEVGCRPIIIGELYGGGNQAGYSVYGYNDDGTPKETGTKLYEDPQVNVMSFTSIGKVFGGGYGDRATMVGNPTVSVNEVYGKYYNDDQSIVGEDAKTPGDYPIPSHAKGKMGAISEVFGGGNAAKVMGNTTVNVGTLAKVSIRSFVEKSVTTGASVEGLYTRSGEGTEESPYIYTAATGNAVAETKYYEEKDVEQDVLGVDIRDNVYGGGNNAEVTGNTNVNIGKKAE